MESLNVTYHSKAIRLSRRLLEDIEAGRFQPGAMLPAESELAGRYQASRSTIRRALSILADQNQLVKMPQRGVQIPVRPVAGDTQPVGRTETGRKLALGAVFSAAPDPALTRLCEGVRQYSEKHGLNFRIYESAAGHDATFKILDHIDRYSVDGILVLPYAHENYSLVLRRLVDRRFPVVSLREVPGLDLNTVCTDNYSELCRSTHYLIEKYHRPVYFLTERDELADVRDCYQGYRQAMAEGGFEQLTEAHICRLEITSDNPVYWGLEKGWLPGYYAARELLKRIEFPAAIACLNDNGARGIYQAAQEQNRVIGKDLFVVGNGDVTFAKLLKPPLTTLRKPILEQGYEAARLLHSLIQNKDQPPVHIRLPVEMIVRESA